MKRVLVVEDDVDLRETLADLLAGEGFQVSCASNGREALDALERQRVDVIVLDLMMPVMSGSEFRAAQLARPHLAGIPVILASAAASAQLEGVDASAVLRKPFTPTALLLRLKELLGAA